MRVKVLYVSGVSTGHLAPLVAVERAVRAIDREAVSLFVCSDKPEDAAYLRHERVEFRQVPLPRRSLRMISAFIKNYRMSSAIIREFKPDVVFSKGGAVSVPACLAAKRAGIPVVLHESDAVMGRANAMVAKWADIVCLGFPQTANAKKSQLSILNSQFITGNPIRPEITKGNRVEGLRITGLSGRKPVLLVWGGSQGAEALNEVIRKNIEEILRTCDVIHLTGKGKKGVTARAGYWSTEFAYAELPHLLSLSDMALSRAGAGTISELAANGIPAILVPIRGLANDHQMKNATTAQENGGCILLLQDDLERDLTRVIGELSGNPGLRATISQSMRKLSQPDAAGLIAQKIAGCVAKERPGH